MSVFRLLILVTICCSQYEIHGMERLPNVVLFLVDDLGWSDVGCYGSSFHETPNIDRLASQGTRFTQAYATCHVCSPSRASILTGKYPARLQLTDWLPGRKDFPFQRLQNVRSLQALPASEITLAELLRSCGYRTGHFGKWHLGESPNDPTQHGFDVRIPQWNKGWPKAGYYAPYAMEGLDRSDGAYLTDTLTEEAERFIESSGDQPFFLYLAHFAVHDPIEGRLDLVDKYQQRLARRAPSPTPSFLLEGNPDALVPLTRAKLDRRAANSDWEGFKVLPERTVKVKQHQDNAQFAAMVESMDQSLGRLLAKLESLELEDNTIIVFTSDNGGMSAANFGNPRRSISPANLDRAFSTSNLPLRGGKGWLYEGGIRIPMIIKSPQVASSQNVCEVPVISTDIYPTLAELTGIAAPPPVTDGISLAPLLTGEPACSRQALFWHFPHYSNHGMQSPGGAVRSGDFKLIEYFENHSVQLFNLKEDIGEQVDLSATQPEKVQELRNQLHNWRMEVAARMPPPNPSFVSQNTHPPD